MNRWKAILRYGLVFALGLALGLVGSHLVIKHRLKRAMQDRPAAQRQMVLRQLTRQLELTKPQQAEIEKIVNVRMQTLEELRKRNQPEIREIFQRSTDEMKAHLTSEQQEKLDRMTQRMRQRLARSGERGASLPPEPFPAAPTMDQ